MASDFTGKAIAIQKAQKAKEEKQSLLNQQKAEKIAAKTEERTYKEQQDALKDIEKQAIDDNKIISKPIPFTGSKTMDDLSAKVVPLVADKVALYTKLMKQDPSKSAELSAKKSNMTRDYQSYVNIPGVAIKGKEYLTKVAKDQSPIGIMLGSKWNSMLDVGTKNVTDNEDGRLIFFDRDQEGNEIPDSGIPVSAIANYGAYQDNSVDYDKKIADLQLAEYSQITSSGGRGQIETKSAKLNPNYEPVVNSFVTKETTTPPDIARILVQFGGYGAYVDGQSNIPPKGQIDPATRNEFVKPVIKFELTDNGGYYPIVTEGMRKEAEAIMRQKVEASIGVDVSKTRNPDVIANTGGGSGPRDIPRGDVAEAKKMVAKLADKQKAESIFRREAGYLKSLKSMVDPRIKNMQIVNLPGGGLGIRGFRTGETKSKTRVLEELTSAADIYAYMKGLNIAAGANEFNQLVDEDINEYKEIVNAGKGQMLNRAAKSTGKKIVKGKYD
jgi:hypothetical protein